MIGLCSYYNLEEKKQWLFGLENGLKAEIERIFNESLANPHKYADYAFANILNRIKEAKAHNEPIIAAREIENARRDKERNDEIVKREREGKEKYAKAINDAEQGIIEGRYVTGDIIGD